MKLFHSNLFHGCLLLFVFFVVNLLEAVFSLSQLVDAPHIHNVIRFFPCPPGVIRFLLTSTIVYKGYLCLGDSLFTIVRDI
ncbi:unnamed protein product [Porites evermanni]|uniref:Secreted protein n=1 Tax=Porites evermanni TaxID=104178 RepID=A0ABN8LXW2_9CNID|nr:unnamed protein product [Porites evermanni]